jgi:hypothetical protein
MAAGMTGADFRHLLVFMAIAVGVKRQKCSAMA